MTTPYQDSKLWLIDYVGLAKDAMHIYVGLSVFLLTALILRVPLRDWRPIATVFLVAIAGEIWDLFEWTKDGTPPAWASNWHDLWNTMFWPLVLFALARSPRLLKP